MSAARALLLLAAAALAAFSCWTLVHQHRAAPRGVLLAVGDDQARALCRTTGTPLAEFFTRARAAGATAVLFPDRSLADLVAGGEIVHFPAAQVSALKAIGLIDPEAAFPEDTLWLPDAARLEQLTGLMREASVHFSSRAYLDHLVLAFPEGIDLERFRVGPDPRDLQLAREAGLEPVYWIRFWDPNTRAVLRLAARGDGFPRLGYASAPEPAFGPTATSGELAVLRAGLWRDGAGAAAVAAASPEEAGREVRRALRRLAPRLLILDLPEAGVEAAIVHIRAAGQALRQAGMAGESLADVFPDPMAPPDWPWLRLPAAFLAALLVPLLAMGASVAAAKRLAGSQLWPIAAPAWQLGTSYAAGAAAAVAGGVLVRGLLGGHAPGPLAPALSILPFLGGGYWMYKEGGPLRAGSRWLERPLRLKDLAAIAVAAVAVWALWLAPLPARSGFDAPAWRALLVGAPAWCAGLSALLDRQSGLRGIARDERPLLLLALWAPVDAVRVFYASPAPYWAPLSRAFMDAWAGAVVGLLAVAAAVYFQHRARLRPRSRWAA